MSNKTRLDVLLVEQGHMESRQKAQAVIMAGSVFVDGQRVDKPGTAVAEDTGVRGNIIDLYYDTYQQCINFGRRTCNVYILK